MSEKKRDGDMPNPEQDNQSSSEDFMQEGKRFELGSSQRTIHHINPLGMRVLVRIIKDHDMSDGGLYLPEGAKDAMAESAIGEVIEVASALDDETDEETNVSGIPLGAKILIPKRAGTKVPWDEDLRIVETKDVLAIVEMINLS